MLYFISSKFAESDFENLAICVDGNAVKVLNKKWQVPSLGCGTANRTAVSGITPGC